LGIKNINLIITGLIVLLTSAYIDNVRGPLLPVLKESFNLNYLQIGTFVIIAYPFAIFATFALNPLLNRWGVKRVVYSVLAIGLCSLFFAQIVSDYQSLLIFGAVLGGSIGCFGTLSNIMVMQGTEPSSRTRMLCALHMMYGLGSFIAPVVVGELIESNIAWNNAFLIWPPVTICLAAFLLWKSPVEQSARAEWQSLKISGPQALAIAAISFYVGAEVLTSVWLATYMTDVAGLSINEAASYVSMFFLSLFLARFVGFIFVTRQREVPAYWIALCLGVVGLVLGNNGIYWGFGLSGAMGLFFPVFLGRISQVFSKQWRSLTVWVLVIMQSGLFGLNYIIGSLSDMIGIKTVFYIPLALIVAASCLVFVYGRWEIIHSERSEPN
jgi:fucose permease